MEVNNVETINKPLYLKTFNNQFQELLDDIDRIIPNNIDIITMRNSLNNLKRMNPKLILTMWYSYVVVPYNKQIELDDYEFFIEKDYKTDLEGYKHEKIILSAIDRMREIVRALDEKNKKYTLQYIKNLCELSKIYSNS